MKETVLNGHDLESLATKGNKITDYNSCRIWYDGKELTDPKKLQLVIYQDNELVEDLENKEYFLQVKKPGDEFYFEPNVSGQWNKDGTVYFNNEGLTNYIFRNIDDFFKFLDDDEVLHLAQHYVGSTDEDGNIDYDEGYDENTEIDEDEDGSCVYTAWKIVNPPATFRLDGRIFGITEVFRSSDLDKANEYMGSKLAKEGVLAEEDGYIYIAKILDEGMPAHRWDGINEALANKGVGWFVRFYHNKVMNTFDGVLYNQNQAAKGKCEKVFLYDTPNDSIEAIYKYVFKKPYTAAGGAK